MNTERPTLSALLSNEREKILACVHCGLCLESCPTYRATGNENDGPRGRVYLMRAVEEGKLKADSETFKRHIDRCLGCRACEQVCPSGVEYGHLLELSRAEIRSAKKSRGAAYLLQSWLLRYIWPNPARLSLLFSFARAFRDLRLAWLALKTGIPGVISRRLSFALALLDASRPAKVNFSGSDEKASSSEPAAQMQGKRNASLFTGCVTAGLFRHVNDATKRVLSANNYETDIPDDQACCGALHLHSGDIDGALALARRNIRAFGGSDSTIVTNAGGCGSMLVNYNHLLADDPAFSEGAGSFSSRVKDISQCVDLGSSNDHACRLENGLATYDASCHLLNGQRASGDALSMIASVVGEDLVPLPGSDVCCGGAGVYNLLEPDLSSQILNEKLENVTATKAKLLATGNPGCHMQIGAGALLDGIELKVCHPVEILDAYYRYSARYRK